MLVDQEHTGFANLIFKSLTNKNENGLVVQSFKTFITNSIDYVFSCEKARWTLFIIMFIFKINSLLMKRCDKELKDTSKKKLANLIETNILDSVDTLRTSSMIFKILSTNKEDMFCYSNEIFNIASYFCNKVFELRPKSIQSKFLSFFKTDSTSENFFKQCFEFIQVHKEKLQKGVLKDNYSKHQYTDELASSCYFVDRNLEKQVLSLMKNFCLHENKEMQNYIREQPNNTKSYNMVEVITEYSSKFLDHLEFPVAFDTFHRTLKCILEFNQGPNTENQEIVIQHGFVKLANEILKMEYKDTVVIGKEPSERKKFFGSSKFIKSFDMNMSLSSHVKNNSFKTYSAKDKFEIASDSVTQPQTNFMISQLKFRCLLILSQLLVGRSRTSSVYYSLRRVLDPEVFRKNFAYQTYFIKKFHKDSYQLKMFFRYNNNVDKEMGSPLIMEIGFQMYFLLLQMTKNFQIDPDEKYHNHLLQFMTFGKTSSKVESKWLLVSLYNFSKKLVKLCLNC